MKTLRLGLIGGNITESRSPALHMACGLSIKRNVSYDLLIPAEQGLPFAEMLQRCEAAGFDGVNVTYPYKEDVTALVPPGQPVVTALGAANTVRFGASGPQAFNTDHTGFIAACRARFGNRPLGRVLLIGAGGVGRAIAFALADLGASEILLHDMDEAKAEALRGAMAGYAAMRVSLVPADRLRDVSGLDGVINATPLGMAGKPGSPLPEDAAGKPSWAFDAVYTPEHTMFRAQTEAMGADFLSGYELYIHQGIQAFGIFSGTPVTRLDWVRQVLTGETDITLPGAHGAAPNTRTIAS